MKKSRSIRLVLAGSLSAGALTSCAPTPTGAVTADSFYTNNFNLPGVGWYHAPFRGFYPHPYNHFDPQTERYFFGGQWGWAPHVSITNISSLTAQAAAQAQAQRTDVRRSGFGQTARHHSVYS